MEEKGQREVASGQSSEIGCGPGSFAEDVTGRDLVCVDPIPEMLSTAELGSIQQGPNVETRLLNS